jgi:hypothetical protein
LKEMPMLMRMMKGLIAGLCLAGLCLVGMAGGALAADFNLHFT